MTWVLQLDHTLFHWINTGWSNVVFDLMMPWITHLADQAVVWLWIAGISILAGWQCARKTRANLKSRKQLIALVRTGLLFGWYASVIYGLKARLFDFAGKFFFRNAQHQSHIVIDKGKCRLCGRCQEMCPFRAITIVNKSIIVDKAKCDFCLCCTEVCTYDAISLKGMLVRKDAFLR
jgi:ferredoxin